MKMVFALGLALSFLGFAAIHNTEAQAADGDGKGEKENLPHQDYQD